MEDGVDRWRRDLRFFGCKLQILAFTSKGKDLKTKHKWHQLDLILLITAMQHYCNIFFKTSLKVCIYYDDGTIFRDRGLQY